MGIYVQHNLLNLCNPNFKTTFYEYTNDKKQLPEVLEIKRIIRILLIFFFYLFCMSFFNDAFAQGETQRVAPPEETLPKFMPYHYLHQQPPPPPQELRGLSSRRVDTKAVNKSKQKGIRAMAPRMK